MERQKERQRETEKERGRTKTIDGDTRKKRRTGKKKKEKKERKKNIPHIRNTTSYQWVNVPFQRRHYLDLIFPGHKVTVEGILHQQRKELLAEHGLCNFHQLQSRDRPVVFNNGDNNTGRKAQQAGAVVVASHNEGEWCRYEVSVRGACTWMDEAHGRTSERVTGGFQFRCQYIILMITMMMMMSIIHGQSGEMGEPRAAFCVFCCNFCVVARDI